MNSFRKFYVPAFVVLVTLGYGGIEAKASSVDWTSDVTCKNTDLSPNSNDCFGTFDPDPKNDNKVDFNNDVFDDDGTVTTGIFGLTGWDWYGKVDDDGTSGTLGLSLTGLGEKSGTWTMTSGILDTFSDAMIILKAGDNFVSYLYNSTSSAEGGDWKMDAIGKDLSHLSVYARKGPNDPPGGPPPIPLPAGLPLLLSALGLGGILRLRQRQRQRKAA